MDVRALVAAPGARKATGDDIMRAARNKAAVAKSPKPGEAARRPDAAPGAGDVLDQVLNKPRTATESAKSSTSLVGTIKKWLKDRAVQKVERQRKAAEQEQAKAKAASEEASKGAQDRVAKLEQELGRLKQQMASQRRPAQPPPIPQQAKKQPAPQGQQQQARGPGQPGNGNRPTVQLKERPTPAPGAKPGTQPNKSPKPLPKPQAKAPHTGQKPPQAKPKPEVAKPPAPKGVPMPGKYSATPKPLLRGKKGGQYYLSQGKKKVYVG